MEMSTKGQGNTFWIIIVAVIALVVLVVLLMIFTGKLTLFETGLTDCSGKGGKCIILSAENCQETCSNQGMGYSSAFTCTQGNQCCCLGVEKKATT